MDGGLATPAAGFRVGRGRRLPRRCVPALTSAPLAGGLTVEESLQFSAGLRLTPDVVATTREAYVLEVMLVTNLLDIKGNLVGEPGESGLSVEQRRRLSIAVELVANPSVVVRAPSPANAGPSHTLPPALHAILSVVTATPPVPLSFLRAVSRSVFVEV